MQIQSTNTVKVSPQCLIYGAAKSGKTRLIPTMPKPFVCSTDNGLSSIRDSDIKFYNCTNWSNFKREFLPWVFSTQANEYSTIVIDDLTELAEQFLVEEKPRHKNMMQAYGQLNDEFMLLIRKFRELQKYLVFICKQDKIKDELTGGMIYSPMFPGKAVQPMLPFLFGEVYHMESYTDPKTAIAYPTLRTKRDQFNQYDAGSRCGKLQEIEFANMGEIFKKMMG